VLFNNCVRKLDKFSLNDYMIQLENPWVAWLNRSTSEYPPRICPGSGQFGKVTGEFIVNLMKATKNRNDSPQFSEFRLLTTEI
jgi:hypothetical protein